MTKQIIVIHGGDTFETYEEYLAFLKAEEVDWEKMKRPGWKDRLGAELGEGFEVIAPKMPNRENAKYLEWKIYFDKLIPFFASEVVLVGHSLGGIFLAKYLSENKFPKKIRATFLTAAPYEDPPDAVYKLLDFNLPADLKLFEQQGGEIYLYQSQDDMVVPFTDVEKYHQRLPQAHLRTFTNRGHFTGPEFTELVADIKKLY